MRVIVPSLALPSGAGEPAFFLMRNGFIQNFGLRELSEASNRAINRIKINSITCEIRDGKPIWVKRRRRGSELIAGQANLFFRLAQGHVHVWVDPKKWQRWEVFCFRLLHAPGFNAFAEGPRIVCMDALPGMHLCQHLKRGTLTPRTLEAAGKELRRAHQLWCPEFEDWWSHGDPHLDNVIYDPATNRARLVDFEVVHDRSLPAVLRQADDLLVFLQDLVCRVSAKQWLPLAFCFINAYGRFEVIAELNRLLVVPTGLPRLWWKLRTENFEHRELVRRVDALRHALGRMPGPHREEEKLVRTTA
jgi:hypothetical protein